MSTRTHRAALVLGNLAVVIASVAGFALGRYSVWVACWGSLVGSLAVSLAARLAAWIDEPPRVDPPRRYAPGTPLCPYVFKDQACGYQGAARSCDKRFSSCHVPERFGGF